MSDAVKILRALPLEAFETPKPNDAWARCSLASASDETLIRSVAATIACPKVQINSSFLLHAPLELLARAWLLQHLPPHKREDARRRIAEIAVRYAGEGPEIESKPKEYPAVHQAWQELSAALRAGDADAVDSACLFLLPRVSARNLRATLAEETVSLLGAAGHMPILLMMLPEAADRFDGSGVLLRAPLRALALEADLRLTWMDTVGSSMVGATPGLFEQLAALPARISVSSDSIAPTMLAVEQDGYAARALMSATNGMRAAEAERILLRVAALSMLQDDPAHAPYGWSHCFTIPQAILSLADVASDATWLVRIAATYVLGFRATLGSARLTADTHQRPSLKAQLIERAALHADAHLAKYTMACLIAADRDPEESALYLAAAAHLAAWWERA
jgi:hypothetical protein